MLTLNQHPEGHGCTHAHPTIKIEASTNNAGIHLQLDQFRLQIAK
jgi:hypothetical protein